LSCQEGYLRLRGAGLDGAAEEQQEKDLSAESRLRTAMELQRSDPAEALRLLRIVLRDFPAHVMVLRLAASIILDTGISPLEEASSLLHRALALSPANAHTLRGLGVATLLSSGSPSAAAMYFSRAVAADPSDPAARCALAAALEGAGDEAGADAAMRAALALHPASAAVHSDYAALLRSIPQTFHHTPYLELRILNPKP
jgi:Tfp pilus assembly protein PilF